jgi:hypothetical protein
MPKIINITNISLKEIIISKINGKITIGLLYSLLDDAGKEYDQKRDVIKNDKLTANQKKKINDILTVVSNKIKQKEEI